MMENNKPKPTFKSKIGLVAATVGSAIGLGNVWRFPAETQANGGAAFLIIYILCVFLLGVPVMIGEFSLGRGGRSDTVGVYKKLSPGTKWWVTGWIPLLASYIILTFYAVVAGWTLEYLWTSVTGDLFAGASGDTSSLFASRMDDYISSPVKPIVYTYIIILANLVILMLGVQKGIERMSNILMPLLFLVLIAFVIFALQLPGASEGLSFFLTPDFSRITPSVVVNALGQAFFSLSLGMGILITYASYFPQKTDLTRTAVTVSLLDMLVAVMMGLIIFPAVTTYGLTGENFEGASLVFVTLPEVFASMPGGQIWAVLFFLLLLVAAVTSTISIAEVTIAFFIDRFGLRRRNACLAVMLPLIILSAICSLSLSTGSNLKIFGQSVFNFADTFATNILLPVGAFLMCIYLGWFAPKDFLKNEMTENSSSGKKCYPVISLIIKYFAPVIILVILAAGLR